MLNDDIGGLFAQQPGNGNTDLGYHIGVVTAWDDNTGSNTVLVNESVFTDLRVITAGPAINIAKNDTVVLLRAQTQYFILGKVAAVGAGAATRSVSSFLTNQEGTTSTTYTDLTTAGPSVTAYVGASGQVLVMLSAQIICDAGTQGSMSFAISGASTQSASDFRGARRYNGTASNETLFTSTANIVQVINLASGSTTFTAKYRTSGGSATFVNRSLIVIPM